jgi:hypothetical protein
MTSRTKRKFQGVTELRTALHGPLLDAHRERYQSADEWDLFQVLIEDEPSPVNFQTTLNKYGVVGDAETAFLANLACAPGGAEVFLMTVVIAWYKAKENRPFDLGLMQEVHLWVSKRRSENALQGAKGTPSTPRKGWVLFNVFKRGSKGIEGGMGSMEGSDNHGR